MSRRTANSPVHERFLRDRLFTPLNMPSTGFQVKREDGSRLTTNYQFAPTGLTPTDAAAPLHGRLQWLYGVAPMQRFGGGTNEIQRMIIATMGLGLPRK